MFIILETFSSLFLVAVLDISVLARIGRVSPRYFFQMGFERPLFQCILIMVMSNYASCIKEREKIIRAFKIF